MLRTKQRKVHAPPNDTLKTSLKRNKSSKISSVASTSMMQLRKISRTKWLILCFTVTFMVGIWFFFLYNLTLAPSTTKNTNTNKNPATNNIDTLTMYVSIATLGDYACPQTITELFAKAKYPQNIYVGIYQQNEGNDPDCLEMLKLCTNNQQTKPIVHETLGDISTLCKFHDHITVNRTNIKDGAKGPVYGRLMSMKLQQFETDFICMIDSHTKFRSNWDEYTISMWFSIEPDHEHAVITHYPWGADSLERRVTQNDPYSYHICGSIYEGAPNFMVRNANGCFAKNAEKPVRVPFFAGGFSFARTQFWKEVPLDPYLLYIFNGEEFDIATRGWTHGYDFYSPMADIVGHHYDKGPKRRSPHVGSNQESHKLRDRSEKRLNYLWGLWDVRYPNMKGMSKEKIGEVAELRDIEKYGLGTKRKLEDFWKFAGINPVTKNITVWPEAMYAKGGLPYVAY